MAFRGGCDGSGSTRLLALVELTEWREKLVRTLSSGMKRRVEIARALIHDFRILFLDEPTVGLDAQSRERIWQYVGRLRRQRELTVVVTTHYIEEVEACDRVCVIDRGKILAMDTPAALKARARPAASAGGAARGCDRGRDHGRLSRHDRPARRARSSSNPAATPSPKHSCRATAAAFAVCRSRSRAWKACFLSLTGREIRDQAAGARERTLAFGRQGGEHTR